MNVPQLLDALSFAPNVEVVIAGLPERSAFGCAQLPGNVLLQHLQRKGELCSFRLRDQQMNMLGHHYISSDVESVPLPRAFQCVLEDVSGSRRSQ